MKLIHQLNKFILSLTIAVFITQVMAMDMYQIQEEKPTVTKYCLSPSEGQELYQLIKDTHDLFTANKIPYTVSSGTLLGLIRHKGIIPWDKDADTQVMLNYKESIKKLVPDFNDLGYKMMERPFGFKFYAKAGKPVYLANGTESGWNFPALDIFFMVEDSSGNTVFETEESRKTWPGEYFAPEELYPLKLYSFGPIIEVYGPSNPFNYLDRGYPGWEKTIIVEVENGLEKKEVDKASMTEDLKKPAPWTGLMKERVQELLNK